jgi:hypothetical protein
MRTSQTSHKNHELSGNESKVFSLSDIITK